MKKIMPLLSLFAVIAFANCKKNADDDTIDYEYHAHIHSPNADAKKVDDVLHIEVDFESHSGETVHHVNVRIYNKSTNAEIYNKPTDAHVHETSGEYQFEDNFVLSEANGVTAHTDWILEASVWGHEGREGEAVEQVEFHVHPK